MSSKTYKMAKINGKYYYINLVCGFCNKVFNSRHNAGFCSAKCVADYRYKDININLVGTKELCTAFSEFLGYNRKYVYPIANVWRFSKRGRYIGEETYQKLYKFNIPCLDRKKNRFTGYMSKSIGD